MADERVSAILDCRGRTERRSSAVRRLAVAVRPGAARPSETEVTMTYDRSAVPQSIRMYLDFSPFGPEHLANSLHHLAELAALRFRS
jgi:hypothetical protein